MKDRRLFAAAALFIVITALKLAFPDKKHEIREATVRLFEQDNNYIQAVETLGKDLKKDSLGEFILETLKNDTREKYRPIEVIRLETEG